MWNAVFLTAALALGQPGDPLPDIAPVSPPSLNAPAPPPAPRIKSISVGASAPMPVLSAAPVIAEPPGLIPDDATVQAAAPADVPPPPQPTPPILINAPLLPPTPKPPAPAAAAAAATPPVTPPYLFMKAVQGTYEGNLLIGNRMDAYGWTEAAYTASRTHATWPMLAQSPTNALEMNQNWLVFERTVVTTGTTEPTFGFQTAWILPGADARFTPSRGLLDHQAGVGNTTEYSYPVDLFRAYVEGFFPTIGQGLDVKIGKNAVPYFAETEDKVFNPLYSHSYIFYYGGPFTHTGIQTNLKINGEWSVENRLVMGDDIVQAYGAQPTYVGALSWTEPGAGQNTALFSVVAGSGRFDYNHPYHTALISAPGQNNLNLVDLVWTHNFNPVLKYTLDANFGYETNVQAALTSGSTNNTAIWYGAANYLSYVMSPRLTANLRYELFDDEEGLRTGFIGLYQEATAGVTFKPRYDIWIRPEVRYDYNGDSRPYNTNHDNPHHDQLSAACDLILRW